ncbi:MAG: GNAT family N-acetyltransferase [Tetragenococcus sp.]|nr:GNAT family N-acetyltransferase [Tetragenococcus sp.]
MYTTHTTDTQRLIYSDALALRKQVFIEEQQVPPEREVDTDEQKAIHFVLYDETNTPLATVRLLPTNYYTIKVQRMAVAKHVRKKGYGKVIMDEAETYAKKRGFQKMALGAQITARQFYHHLGYQEEGDYFLDAGIQHITMVKNIA